MIPKTLLSYLENYESQWKEYLAEEKSKADVLLEESRNQYGILQSYLQKHEIPLAVKLAGNENNILSYRDVFENWLERKIDYAVCFTSLDRWTNSSGQFIGLSYFLPRLSKINRPIIWTIALCPNDTTKNNYLSEILAGKRDFEFTREAKLLSSFRPQDEFIYIRLGHECNGDWYQWSPRKKIVTSGDYVAAFRRVVSLFKLESPRFKFVWNTSVAQGTKSEAEALYPGNDVVDVISMDVYMDKTGYTAYESFQRFKNHSVGLKWLLNFSINNDKPYAIDEWGAIKDSPEFVILMNNWFSYYKPLWQGWWDSNSGYPSMISNENVGGTSAAYKQAFGYEFSQKTVLGVT